MFHDVQHGSVLNCIEGFGKIKFQQDNFLLRAMALVNILEGPSKAILYCSPLNETILVLVYDL